MRKNMKIKRGEDIRHAERSCCVSAPSRDEHFYNRLANGLRLFFKTANLFFRNCHCYQYNLHDVQTFEFFKLGEFG